MAKDIKNTIIRIGQKYRNGTGIFQAIILKHDAHTNAQKHVHIFVHIYLFSKPYMHGYTRGKQDMAGEDMV